MKCRFSSFGPRLLLGVLGMLGSSSIWATPKKLVVQMKAKSSDLKTRSLFEGPVTVWNYVAPSKWNALTRSIGLPAEPSLLNLLGIGGATGGSTVHLYEDPYEPNTLSIQVKGKQHFSNTMLTKVGDWFTVKNGTLRAFTRRDGTATRLLANQVKALRTLPSSVPSDRRHILLEPYDPEVTKNVWRKLGYVPFASPAFVPYTLRFDIQPHSESVKILKNYLERKQIGMAELELTDILGALSPEALAPSAQ